MSRFKQNGEHVSLIGQIYDHEAPAHVGAWQLAQTAFDLQREARDRFLGAQVGWFNPVTQVTIFGEIVDVRLDSMVGLIFKAVEYRPDGTLADPLNSNFICGGCNVFGWVEDRGHVPLMDGRE